jgi:hypothetical protein
LRIGVERSVERVADRGGAPAIKVKIIPFKAPPSEEAKITLLSASVIGLSAPYSGATAAEVIGFP